MFLSAAAQSAGRAKDLNSPGVVTPTRIDAPRLMNKRRQTLLSLLDALNELNRDSDFSGPSDFAQQPSFEDDRDVPTVDEHLQVVGSESFNKFQGRISNLDRELRNFANASRQLGSSVAILSSSHHLRDRLAQILFLFRENAADLYPRKVARQPRETILHISPTKEKKKKKRRNQRTAPPTVARMFVDDKLEPEDFPFQFQALAKDVMTFLNCLNEFPEFTDEAVNSSILSFNGDLKYWASCLEAYSGQFRYPAVQRYLHDLANEMGEHIDSITSALGMFIEVGVPTIRFAQKHGANNLLNLSTVATFFSAVTATTIQYSYNLPITHLADAVNSFWFCSLVFSIAAAVNSLLGLTWKQAMYRSPGHRVPWWVLIWIKRSPLIFLVASVACFSVGLVLFTYASGQSHVTCTITSVFTAITSFGLAAVSAWFATERWIFLRHKGQKWLGDVLIDMNRGFLCLPGVLHVRKAWMWGGDRLDKAREKLTRVSTFSVNLLSVSSGEKLDEDSIQEPSMPVSPTPEPFSPGRIPRTSDVIRSLSSSPEPQSPKTAHPPTSFTSTFPESPPSTSQGAPTTAKGRFANAVRSIIMLQSASSAAGAFMNGTRGERARPSPFGVANGDGSGKKGLDGGAPPRSSRVATLVPKLKALEATQDLPAHQALVRHLQFSPDGKFLATSSWDRTSVIFRVGEPFISHRILAHPAGFVGQVAWAPTGNLLLTKLNRSIKVWTHDGVCRKTIDRHQAVQSIAWLPGGEAFMSVEGSDVTKLDINGNVLDTYHFDRMMLHDVAITPDCVRLLGVGPLTASPTGLQPSKSRVEKRLIVYNLESKITENQTPVLNDVRDITLARNGLVALVSYENKAPPQLWKLDHVRSTNSMRLSLRHTYMPRMSVDFAGPSYFGGKDDQLVLCAAKAGDIHIWDRESATLLHHVRAQALGGDLTCIAWNPAAESPFMFATGSHDGAVRIWTDPRRPDGQGGFVPRGPSPVPTHLTPPTTGTSTPRRTPSPWDPDRLVESPQETSSSSPQFYFGDPGPGGRSVAFASPQGFANVHVYGPS